MGNFLESKKIRAVLIGLGSLIILLVIFGAGIAVGYNRANFGMRYTQNYSRNFIPGMPSVAVMPTGMPAAEHGMVGTVIDVSTSSISVEDPDSNEQSVAVSPDTIIREMNDTISIMAIELGDHIVVIGEPNAEGQVSARFIRVFTGSSSVPVPYQGQ